MDCLCAGISGGFNKGLGGGADDINFKSERDKVSSKLSGYKVLLHTPNLTIYGPGGAINTVATTNHISSTLLAEREDKRQAEQEGVHGDQLGADRLLRLGLLRLRLGLLRLRLGLLRLRLRFGLLRLRLSRA